MITYTYIVRCPECEDEFFDFFDEAKDFAMGCLTKKPIITQTEVNRNDFGECTDHCDLGTVWSWEDMMNETDAEPATSVFNKDDLKLMADGKDPEFDAIDNSVDFEIPEVSEREPITESKADPFHEAIFEAIDYLTEFNDIFPVPENIGADTWKELKDDINYGLSSDFEIAEIIMEYLDKDLAISRKHPEMFEDDPQSELTLETYNRLKRAYDRAVAAYEAEHPEDFEESCERKPIPEGMTIEQLVEEMEENEDTVECTWCNDLFDKSECRKEVDLGWLCSRCEAAIKSRGETLTFRENNYWDFLDEAAAVSDGANAGKRVRLVYNNSKYHNDGEPYQLFDLKKLFKSSDIRELDTASINLIAKFDNSCKIIQETDKAYLVTVPCYYRNQQDRSKFEERPKYIRCWVPKTQTEFINESISEDPADVETLHDLGNTYDGGYPAEDNLTEAEELAKKPFDRWEKVELYYPEIGGGYEYITDKDEITDALVDIVTDEDVKQFSNGRWQTVDEITDYDSEHYYKDKAAYPVHEWTAFLENNYDDLFEKYEDEVYAALRKWAKEKYEKDRENIDADNYWLNYADHLYHSRKDAEFD
jgi:hypothetical protein